MQKLFLPKPLAVPNQGWTLMEMAIVSVIVGILSSLAIPSMMSAKGKNDLRSAMGQVKGAIQEAQRSAIKNGQSCTVIINPTTSSASVTVSGTSVSVNAKTIAGSPAGCISSTVSITDTDTTFTTPTTATNTNTTTTTINPFAQQTIRNDFLSKLNAHQNEDVAFVAKSKYFIRINEKSYSIVILFLLDELSTNSSDKCDKCKFY